MVRVAVAPPLHQAPADLVTKTERRKTIKERLAAAREANSARAAEKGREACVVAVGVTGAAPVGLATAHEQWDLVDPSSLSAPRPPPEAAGRF